MQKRIEVVFVSRRNSLRSVLAEACLAHLDAKRFSVRSCGQPGRLAADVHPAAVEALGSAGMALPTSPPRSWDLLARAGSHNADVVITLDPSLEPLQPRWPGQPDAALWPYPDVAGANTGPDDAAHGALQVLYSLRRRLELLVNLPLVGADRSALRSDIRDMAHMR
ncbi:low molecular weight phosphatase family protein [Variovorax boronicumulans]|uniref:Protein tyrosine phosphatase n=1 Tax=Variovorax boronicumulans TaxID=436515 RepID=A0A1E7U869_9BURK|nr:protein tyrosine phosphatase [Variovorax boronicumulans]ATA55525.1 protein tyrosine phosphatase [Variovorax boronicumulans]OEZ32294.1 protein tyrosine phosphatase [Variovorax boronicumulans]PBI94957.1 Low molecular weight phosphotyrosine protein phosphatase [Variovorax boronicumulans]GER15651.1 protein tyrosine phosphatase [Variovorax boronicumulans]